MKKFMITLLICAVMFQVCTVSAAVLFEDNFESTSYTLNASINGINGWATSSSYIMALDPINSENHTLKLDSTYSDATNIFSKPLTNVGSDGLTEVSFRMMLSSSSSGSGFYLKDASVGSVVAFGYGPVGNGYCATGKEIKYNAKSIYLLTGQDDSKLGPNQQLAGGNVDVSKTYVLQTYANATKTTWYYARMFIDFRTGSKKVDCYLATTPITDTMIQNKTGLAGYVLNVPFRTLGENSSSVDRIKVVLNASNTDTYFDDFVVTDPFTASVPVYSIVAGSAAYTASGSAITATADITKGDGSGISFAAAFDAEGGLLGVSDVQSITADNTYSAAIENINASQVAKVKVFVWGDMNDCQPLCASGEAQLQ